MTQPLGARARPTPHADRQWAPVVTLLAVVAIFLGGAAIGAVQDARGERVLAVLDPLIAGIRSSGQWLWQWSDRTTIGWASTGTLTAIALVGLIACGRRAAPLVLFSLAGSLATWGHIFLQLNQPTRGAYLYLSGMLCAVGFGAWRPLSKVQGFPGLPRALGGPRSGDEREDGAPGGGRDEGAARARLGAVAPASVVWWECVLVFGLAVVALLTRLYALNELPHSFDGEMIGSMLASRTSSGLRAYVPDALLGNSTGFAHHLPQFVLFHLFGTSVYSLRLAALAYGFTAVLLLYWLVRRIAGVGPAIAATVLFIASPEQLLWSRSENTHFAPIAVLALVTGHVGLWMIQRYSLGSVLVAALWMPFCRYFYAPGMVMVLYPVLLYGHAVVFVRRAWRKAWYAVPILAGGVALWIFSLSVLDACVQHGHWRFLNPAVNGGAPVWRKQGQLGDASVPELIRVQAVSMWENLGKVVTLIAAAQPATLNIGVAVLLALGIGYLLGQLYERRSFGLLAWVALGLLPGVMSVDPADRRIALVFPAIYAIVGVILGAVVRVARAAGGRALARLVTATAGVTVAAIVWTNLAGHFLRPIQPPYTDSLFRFGKPLFEQSDTILFDIDHSMAVLLAFGNVEHFLRSPVAYQFVNPAEWLDTALHPRCNFREEVYGLFPPPQVERLRAAYRPRRISFLLLDNPANRAPIELLRALYPKAPFHTYHSPQNELRFAALTVDIADVEALHSPSLFVSPGAGSAEQLQSTLLAGIGLTPQVSVDRPRTAAPDILVRGGILPRRDGWYRVGVGPPCSDATISVDQRPVSPGELRTLLAGVHPFEIGLPSSTACRLPLQLLVQPYGESTTPLDPSEVVVSSAMVALQQVQPQPLLSYAGYGEAKPFAHGDGTLVDFGVTPDGHIAVVANEGGRFQVRVFDGDGRRLAAWQPQTPEGHNISAMTVAPDGAYLLRVENTLFVHDRSGQPIDAWKEPLMGTLEFGVLPDGHILGPVPNHNSIAILGRTGAVEREWTQFDGGPGKFEGPLSVTASAFGDVLVVEAAGQALLFRTPLNEFAPAFVTAFRVDLHSLTPPRGIAFDGPDRIVIPDWATRRTLVYNPRGERVMAADPAHDLSGKGFGEVHRVQSAGSQLYVLDESRQLWSMPRRSATP